MGRKRSAANEEQEEFKKKAKKVKRRKHHVIKDSDDHASSNETVSSHPPLTLKIKLGGKEEVISTTRGSDQLSVGGDTSSLKSSSQLGGGGEDEWAAIDSDVSVGDGSFSQEADEEEEVWLNALESGLVNERGYLPQVKDPIAMTARQRAMLGSKEEELLELPLMKKQDEMESEEMLLKKTERNKKRRLQAIKRREKHKAETVQKLLQKQSTKKKEEEKKATPQVVGPHLRYIDNSKDGSTTISLTDGLNYPVTQGTSKEPPAIVKCHMCNEVKRYNHSTYNVPLCSLECYRKLELISAVK